MTSTLTTAWTQQTTLGTLDRCLWSVFPLNEDKRYLLKEKPNSFKFRFGRELKRHVNGCLGENNLHLEQGKKYRTKAVSWYVVSGSAGSADSAGSVSVSSKERFFPASQKSAGSAGSVSVSSKEKNSPAFQIVIEKNQSENGGNNYPHYPHYPHIQREEMPQDSLGSGLAPIKNNIQNAVEFSIPPALLQPVVPSLALPKNLQGQEEPEREWSEEELELLRELDDQLEDDDAMRYDWESSWDEIDDPFLADLRIGATLCCGQPLSEQYFKSFPEADIPDECDQLRDVCLQCGAEACHYDGDGEGFCGNDCYRAYHQQPQVSPEPVGVTQEETFLEQDVAAVGEQFPQAAREIPSGLFFQREIAKRYQLRATKQQRKWFVRFSTRSMQWLAPFSGKQLVYMAQYRNVSYCIACKQWPHQCRPPTSS